MHFGSIISKTRATCMPENWVSFWIIQPREIICLQSWIIYLYHLSEVFMCGIKIPLFKCKIYVDTHLQKIIIFARGKKIVFEEPGKRKKGKKTQTLKWRRKDGWKKINKEKLQGMQERSGWSPQGHGVYKKPWDIIKNGSRDCLKSCQNNTELNKKMAKVVKEVSSSSLPNRVKKHTWKK